MRFIISLVLTFCILQILLLVLSKFFKPLGNAEISFDNNKAKLNVSSNSKLPLCYKVKIKVENLYTGEAVLLKTKRILPDRISSDIEIFLKEICCGVVRLQITELKSAFIGSFFMFKSQQNVICERLYLPEASSLSSVNKSMISKMINPGEGERYDGVREYRHGENFKDIHMKLSAKSGKYMVRERLSKSSGSLSIGFLYEANYAVENVQLLISILSKAVKSNINCIVYFSDKSVEALNDFDVQSLLYRILSQSSGENTSLHLCDYIISGGEVNIN